MSWEVISAAHARINVVFVIELLLSTSAARRRTGRRRGPGSRGRSRRWSGSLWDLSPGRRRAASRPQARHSVLGMRVGCRAVLHSAERAASLLTWLRIAGDATIPESLRRLPGRVPCSFRNRSWCDVLSHIPPVLVPQARIRIRHAAAMLGIVRPDTGTVGVANVSTIEIVFVDECVIHN